MAKKVTGYIKLQIPAAKATPAPPVGPGSKPVPLTDAEVRAMGIGCQVENLDIEVGESVRVVTGPFADSVGQIQEINANKKTLVVSLSIFGRETPVELDFAQIDKL